MGQTRGVIPPSPVLLVNGKRDPCVVTACKGCYSRVCGSADISPTGVWVTSGGPAVAVVRVVRVVGTVMG